MKSRPPHFFFFTGVTISALLFFLQFAAGDDGTIMAKFSKGLNPPPSGWSGSNYCKWTGISCDSSNRVTSISLAGKSISGQLPSDLNELTELKSISIQRNSLSGPLPALTNLSSLQEAYFDNNNFSSIPPAFFSGLNSLQSCSLSNNVNLSPWTIPNELSDCSSLVSFFAGKANVIGTMPDIFGSFPNLQSLRLSYNNLTGTLPASFAGSAIQNLWLNNQLIGISGSLDVLGKMTQLIQAWLHVNLFSGPIPDLSKCIELFDLQLRENEIRGIVPPTLTSLPKLVNVSLQNNKLQGPYPEFGKGVDVTLGTTNNFCTSKAGEPCDPQVTTLLAVASALGYPMTLAQSWKGNDPCQGWTFISCDAGKKSVTVVNFGKQHWIGTISPDIANLTSLTSLLMNDNNLSGPIPDGLVKLPQLRLVDVSNNNLSGIIPPFSSKVILKTAGNPLLGNNAKNATPPSGGDANNATPPSGGDANNATAPAPAPAPSGDAGDAGDGSDGDGVSSASESNPMLLAPTPSGSGQPRPSSVSHVSHVSPGVIGGIISLAVVLIGLGAFFVYTKRRRQEPESVQISKKGNQKINNSNVGNTNAYGSALPIDDGGNVLIPIDVLREVTNNFSDDNILGRGGFGIVYKGVLHDGTQIAVKRMEANMVSSKGMSEFQAEIGVLTKVRHKHLVALLGYCINGNERLLVYEYMPQGTLGEHLFDRQEGVSPLTWKQRITIALDVARGVEYLHSLAQQSFIHRDLKPSNVLLGDDMRAKVSDFGLVKSAPEGGQYSVETRLAGTFGYLAPEYAATGRVTLKVDVFSFGVILMELITGRKSLDDSLPEDRSHLVTWFRKLVVNKDNIRNHLLDPSLNPDDETFESICKVTELAGYCTSREPYQRPDMGHAVNVLAPLVEQWKPTQENDDDDSFGIDLHMSLTRAVQGWKESDSSTTMTSNFYNSHSKKTFQD